MRLALRVGAAVAFAATGIAACSDEFTGVDDAGDAGSSSTPEGGAPGEGGTTTKPEGGESPGGTPGAGGTPSAGGDQGLAGQVNVGGDVSVAGGPTGAAGAGGTDDGGPTVANCTKLGADPYCRNVLGVGSYATCAIASGGRIKCWGLNDHYQLGDGLDDHGPCGDDPARDCSATPVPVKLEEPAQLGGGEITQCALNAKGHLYCWGYDLRTGNDSQEPARWGTSEGSTGLRLRLPFGLMPGDGTLWVGGLDIQGNGVFGSGVPAMANEHRYAAAVAGLDQVTAFDVGWYHSCAVSKPGAVACWGKGVSGELGDGFKLNRSGIVGVKNVSGATAVAVGDAASCARVTSGAVWCWGSGLPGGSAEPALKSGLANIAQLAGGFGHFCAMNNGGKVLCWGKNDYGQVGAPPDMTGSVTAPHAIEGLNDAVAIGVGAAHSCALRKNGAVLCWGNNQFGQLGDGSFANSSTPRAVKDL